jgi:hypothetical protein
MHQDGRIGICLAVGIAGLWMAAAGGQQIASDFSVDPRRQTPAWTYSGPSDAGYSASDRAIVAQADIAGTWRSPGFAVKAGGYYRISFDASTADHGLVDLVSSNPNAGWGIIAGTSDLIADAVTSVLPSKSFTPETYFARAQANAVTASLVFWAGIADVSVNSVSISEGSDVEVAAWDDSVYQSMPPLTYVPPSDRFAHLPRTQAALNAHGPLKIVLLGDSIMNDTSNCTFESLVERRYPGAKITLVAAVGGGAGMQNWNPLSPRHTAHLSLQQAVIDQEPDLVMIGGISNSDIAEIASVISQVRTGVRNRYGYTPDILLMTGAFGANDNPLNPHSDYASTVANYDVKLAALAAGEGTGFMDMHSAWGQYMITAQEGVDNSTIYNSFFRDERHANTRGKEILARALDDFFAPVPERVNPAS